MKKSSTLVFLTLIVLISCRKEKFVSESNWVVPVLESELNLGDILPDSLSKTNSDGSMDVVYETSYGVSNVSDIVQIPDTIEVSEVTLSSLTLDDRSFNDTLTLLELYPASALFHNQTTILPGQDIQANEGTVVDVTEEFFTTATFVSGYIDITIFNESDGLVWKMNGGRQRSEKDLITWKGKRGGAGKMVPNGFPKPPLF